MRGGGGRRRVRLSSAFAMAGAALRRRRVAWSPFRGGRRLLVRHCQRGNGRVDPVRCGSAGRLARTGGGGGCHGSVLRRHPYPSYHHKLRRLRVVVLD